MEFHQSFYTFHLAQTARTPSFGVPDLGEVLELAAVIMHMLRIYVRNF